MATLNDIAAILNVSTNTIRNKIEKYKTHTGIDFYALGTKDPIDSRRTIYPSSEVEKLIQFIDPTFQQASQLQPETASQPAPIVTVEPGNHRTALDTPHLQTSLDLGDLRDSESITFDDPLSVAAQYLQAADMVIAAMEQDAAKQRQKVADTEAAAKAIADKKQELVIQKHIYTATSRDIASRQNAATTDLQQALEGLQTLEKKQG